jgi:hypothetical protein
VPPILSLLRDVGDNEAHVRIIGIWYAPADRRAALGRSSADHDDDSPAAASVCSC